MRFMNYFLSNYVMLFELIGLFIITIISIHLSDRVRKYTRITIFLLFFLWIVYSCEIDIRTYPNLTVLRSMLTATKYTLYPLVLVLLLPLATQFKNPFSNKIKIIILIPIIISALVFFTSQWTGIVFKMDRTEGGSEYTGGPLSLLPYAVFGCYLLFFIIINIIYLSKFSSSNQRVSLYITIFAYLGILLYSAFDYTEDYTSIFTSAVLLYFIFLYINLASIDNLTGLLNRQSYYRALTKSNIYAIISIDMNELKYLNDTFGHDAGDLGIKTISNVFLQFSDKNHRFYRVGGDEFCCLFFKESLEEEVKYFVDKLKEEMAKTEYSCAFGYALNETGDDDKIDDVIKLADERMYEDKNEIKRISKEKGKVIHFRDDN